MKRKALLIFVLMICIMIAGCTKELPKEQPQNDEADKNTVTNLVMNFGKKLQNVSLLASEESVKQSIKDNYGAFVSAALLEKWQIDPQSAPGRMVSSPWPDRIEILSNEKTSEGAYNVHGEIIEITSVEQSSGGVAAKRPIILTAKKMGDSWLIDSVTLGAYSQNDSVIYKNTQYGFVFSLPKSWSNYSIVIGKWEGRAVAGPQSGKIITSGELIIIRHPEWTSQNPRQDIPIMIYTIDQWNSLQHEEFSVGAAPIPPSELARNSKYVFALPARYNYAFPTGFEEVENILANSPLKPI
jgi:hypothetical protein